MHALMPGLGSVFSTIALLSAGCEKKKRQWFTVIANNVSESNMYVQSAQINGEVLNVPWFRHADIRDGGVLELFMGNKPSDWGRGAPQTEW